MIGRVYRGSKVAGLVRYLFGPGRHNEHENPRLVAAWDATTQADLSALTPPGEGVGPRYFGGLVAELEAPMAYAPNLGEAPVWHCPLRVADTDRVLSDAEWGRIAADLMDRTGLAPAGDDGGVRWVAVRHDKVSIHVVATLARQDGAYVNLSYDYRRVREACLAAEAKYGLVATAPINGTAVPATTRPETEKAGRNASARSVSAEEPRVRVRREVRAHAGAASDERDFMERLRSVGLKVSLRHSTLPGHESEVTGYSVGVPGDLDKDKRQILFGGGRLAPDLTLPKLREVWAAAAPTDASTLADVAGPAPAVPAADASGADLTAARGVPEATRAPMVGPVGRVKTSIGDRSAFIRDGAEQARRLLAAAADGALDDRAAATLLGATGEGMAVIARSVEGPIRGPLTAASASFERASRLPRQAPSPVQAQRSADLKVSRAGRDMRRAIRSVARSGTVAGREDTGAALELAAALLLLALAAAELHRARGDAHSAAAAVQAGDQLTRYQKSMEAKPAKTAKPELAVRPTQAPTASTGHVPPPPSPPALGR